MRCAVSVSLVVAASISLAQAAHLSTRATTFNWTALPSSSHLKQTSCYDGYQCAKLTMPLQYSDPAAGEAQIAMIISPSNYSVGDPNYLGPILFNPGGPGNSGVHFLLELGYYFRAIIGPQYDLVGFDPRGIGFSTPALTLFENQIEALDLLSTYPINLNESVSSLGRAYALSQVFSQLAVERVKLAAESVSTPAVATDMLNIARAFGYDEVNYWGVSYGSILGSTFAAMYPDYVGRFIIDGVGNAHEWYAGIDRSSLLQADNALTSIYDDCVSVGPSLCALWANSTDAVRTRVDNILNTIHFDPVPVSNGTTITAPGVVDYSTVMTQLSQMLYWPFANAQSTAQALVALEQGSSEAVYQGSFGQALGSIGTCDFDPATPFVAGFIDSISPIVCGDSQGRARTTVEGARAAYQALADTSEFASSWYPGLFGPCATWDIEAKDKFNGSFTTNTSSPILFISNTFDPVTPIDSARNMSAGFENSVLLQQNSTGHTSLSGFSTCTALAIRSYYVNGTLPAPGTICQTDTQIFENPGNSSAQGGVTFPKRAALRYEDVDFAEAVHALRESDFMAKHSWIRRAQRVRKSTLLW